MGVKIHIQPDETWSFFDENLDRLKEEMVEIAANEDTGHAVYLTEDGGYPLLFVYRGDSKIYEEYAVSRKDCEDTVKNIYFKYLFPVIVCKPNELFVDDDKEYMDDVDRPDIDDEEYYEELLNDAIYEREDELHFATTDFLEVALNCTGLEDLKQNYGDIIDDFLEDMCVVLAQKYSISVYRPTWVPDEANDECEVYVEYPYLELDDDGIPISNTKKDPAT